MLSTLIIGLATVDLKLRGGGSGGGSSNFILAFAQLECDAILREIRN